MRRILVMLPLIWAGFLPASLPAQAASFDCTKASTPFEKAICGDEDLSKADERLARSYATAIGGLSEAALEQLRRGQREWLNYAQRACTRDAEPLTTGSYDDRGITCLGNLFASRSATLETSRMISGIRFYPISRFDAAPDPYEADNPDSNWPVSQHELSIVQIDGDEEFAKAFNRLVREDADFDTPPAMGEDGDDSSSDSDNSILVEKLGDTRMITATATTYWYGHGAAHGNWGVSYRHFLVEEGRWLEARDVFAGKGWQKALLDLTVAALEAEHGDMLMLDDTSYIADSVTDPARWDLSDPYGLIIQFQPYEVAAYAYGAPTARISWEALERYRPDGPRYGY